MQFSMQLEVNDNVIKVRSKRAVSVKVPWGPWHQMMPHPDVSESKLPPSDAVPEMQTQKEWSEFEDTIVPALTKFYDRKFSHPVYIPAADKQEMLSFLQEGPVAASVPKWFDWDSVEGCSVRPADKPSLTTSAMCAPEPKRTGVWRPFLQPRPNRNGKKCKCGSTTHAKVTHSSCPLNTKRARDPDGNAGPPRARVRTHKKNSSSDEESEEEPDEDSSSDSSEDVLLRDVLPKTPAFPYPIGTRVAVEFSAGLFAGEIIKLFSDANTCLVIFSDGDKGEYDADEIRYAQSLYQREFVENKPTTKD